MPPETPLFDVFAYLSFLADQTSQLRLGTNVYLMGLRHPFIAARAIQTQDIVSEVNRLQRCALSRAVATVAMASVIR